MPASIALKNALDLRFERLEERVLNNSSFTEYFGIAPPNENEELDIKLVTADSTEGIVVIDILFQKHTTQNLLKIPIEIIRHIDNFNHYYLRLRLKLTFPVEYPFQPPVWSLEKIQQQTKPTHVDMKEYYEYIIEKHNSQNATRWSPSTFIDKDILLFFTRINHFEYLTEAE